MNTDLIKRLREAQVNGEASIYGECADALEAQQPTGDAADVVEELLYLKRNYLKRYSNKTQAIVSKATALIQQQARQAIADELEERSLRGQVATLTERNAFLLGGEDERAELFGIVSGINYARTAMNNEKVKEGLNKIDAYFHKA
jgi:hypothetical protein